MDSTAIVTLVIGAVTAITWLLTLSYFLGRNAANLDNLSKAFDKLEKTITSIFSELKGLSVMLPHHCDKTSALASLAAQTEELGRRITELEAWRNRQDAK